MELEQRLSAWIEKNCFDIQGFDYPLFCLNNELYMVVSLKEVMITEKFELVLTEKEREFIEEVDWFVFMFGEEFYKTKPKKLFIEPFKTIGKAPVEHKTNSFLGVHGKYELMNGTGDYRNWCRKANFLHCKNLGSFETSLAGIISFQNTCLDYEINPILGQSIKVTPDKGRSLYGVKIIINGEEGLKSIFRINKNMNVDNHEIGLVDEDYLLKNLQELYLIFEKYQDYLNLKSRINVQKTKDWYYAISSVEYKADQLDKEKVLDLEKYYLEFLVDKTDLKPILLEDAYYLNQEDHDIKRKINLMATGVSHRLSQNQHFKSWKHSREELSPLFVDQEKFSRLWDSSIENLEAICNPYDFRILTNKKQLPKFMLLSPFDKVKGEYTAQELEERYEVEIDDNLSLFYNLIEKGITEKLSHIEDLNPYFDRLEEEIRIIKKGGFIDYFLILWDIITWCSQNDILTGIGRGSSGGSLVAYLLGVTQLDPLQYNLLFERFLNESRIKKSVPDIDVDFQHDRREDVKKYMKEKYGREYITSICSYTSLQLRAAVQEVSKFHGIPPGTVDYITKNIYVPIRRSDTDTWSTLIEQVVQKAPLKKFAKENPQIIYDIQLILGIHKNRSLHAAGQIIVPMERTIFEWLPIKWLDGQYATDWEGEFIEEAGFLKEDILGLNQLTKFSEIIGYVKKDYGYKIDLNKIDLQDQECFSFFQKGYNEDVFQFTADGVKAYCRELQPYSIEDLIATIALYRPGPIESGTHHQFIRIRNGEEDPEYGYMLYEITKNTGGLFIYQEQIMQACQILGGMDLDQADKVRKAMGKMKPLEIEKWQSVFVEGAVKKGCDEEHAKDLWKKMEAFAKYGFNRSHAAAYGLTAYRTMYLKVKYPLQFWTTSLNHSTKEQLPKRIQEINQHSNIKLSPPDINKSGPKFSYSLETNTIYWSLSSIPHCSQSTMRKVQEEIKENGPFSSFKNLRERIPKKELNGRQLKNLILAGCFDEMYNVGQHYQLRALAISDWAELHGIQTIPDEFMENLENHNFWVLKQRENIGYGDLDFRTICKQSGIGQNFLYVEPEDFQNIEPLQGTIVFSGIIQARTMRSSKRGPFLVVELNCNDCMIDLICWNESYEEYKKDLEEATLICCTGKMTYDTYRKKNVIFTYKNTVLKRVI